MKIIKVVIAFSVITLLMGIANSVLDVPADLPWWRAFGGWLIVAAAVYVWDRWGSGDDC